MFRKRNETGSGGMGFASDVISAGLRSKAEKARGKNKWIPLGCAALPFLCGAVYQMSKVLDFTAIAGYVNAYISLLK